MTYSEALQYQVVLNKDGDAEENAKVLEIGQRIAVTVERKKRSAFLC